MLAMISCIVEKEVEVKLYLAFMFPTLVPFPAYSHVYLLLNLMMDCAVGQFVLPLKKSSASTSVGL
jgi:hypothetical protein